MATIHQVRCGWSSGAGLPGVSTFYFNGLVDTDLQVLKAFWGNFTSVLPSGMVVNVPDNGVTIDTTTGQPNGAWNFPEAGGDSVGVGAGNYAGPVGAVINWTTGVFLGGRRLRGKTFIVPLVSSCFDGSGSLSNSLVTSFTATAQALAEDASEMSVYSRKNQAVARITGAQVPDLAAVLRSRRD